MILVVGATGHLGTDICRRLSARGAPVRALVRPTSDPAKVAALRDLGIELVEGDVRDRASLDRACQGLDAVVSTVSAMPFSFQPGVNDIETTDLRGEIDLIDAARRAGVHRFVYTSFSKNLDLDFPLRAAKRTVEAHLRESGMTYTILRPSCFMEVWLSPAVGFDATNATATIYGDGTAPLSWIALGDVAEFAVRSLDHPAALDATIELGGPLPLAPLEVVRIFEQVGGRPFEVRHVPVEDLVAQQAAAPDDMSRSFAGLMRCYAAGDPIAMDETANEFGIELTPVRAYAEQVLGKVPVAAR